MASQQGDVSLLQQPVAQELLRSTQLAQLAYVWKDGTPRVIPIWFQWNGTELVFASLMGAPKLEVMHNQKVAVTINNGNSFPYQILLIRGTAQINIVPGIAPEYVASAYHYFGNDGGKAWMQQVEGLGAAEMARIVVKPEWVGLMDFQTRFPSAMEKAMEAAAAQGTH